MPFRFRRAFTLVELLIVIGVIAILSVVVILVLNPSEILKQSRDASRISDLSTMKTVIALYASQGGSSFGNASTSYISVPDPTATSSLGNQCQGLSLATLPAGWTYHCAASSSYKNIDGTGWIPVNFTTLSSRTPIERLPVDPINTASTGNYFTYSTLSATYELTAPFESQKYATTTSIDGGKYADLYETGSNLALAPADYVGGTGSSHNSYTYARAITMSNSNVSGTLSNFPMLFSGTYSYLAASSSAGNVQSANGYDIIFASDSGCTTKLNFEQEGYTSSTGAIIDWVNVPSITGGTVIYLCYGNGSTVASQTSASSTWDGNYEGVWHLPDGSSLTANDSTGANNGTISGTTAATGEIGGGGSFNGTSNYISVGASNAYSFGTTATLSGWFNTSNNNNAVQKILSLARGAGSTGFAITYNNNTLKHAELVYRNGANGIASIVAAGTPSNSTWHYIVGTISSGNVNLYYDGTLASTAGDANSTNSLAVTSDLAMIGALGSGNGAASANYFAGSLDELRVSKSVRSASWILSEYNNQSSPSTFYTVGSPL